MRPETLDKVILGMIVAIAIGLAFVIGSCYQEIQDLKELLNQLVD